MQFEEWFLRYRPADTIEKEQEKKQRKQSQKTKTLVKNKKQDGIKGQKTKKRGRGGLFY
jgi:hypothetical protein